ncbi:MAG TPA: hypothetical protein VE261_01210 [Gaiellaceae bacterium]|nr:hypothetical protein [Gaiellaceae bacterium]
MWPLGCWTPGWLAPLSLPVIGGPIRKVESENVAVIAASVIAGASHVLEAALKAEQEGDRHEERDRGEEQPAAGAGQQGGTGERADVVEHVRGDAGERAPGDKQRVPHPPGGAPDQTGTDVGRGERAHCGALPLGAVFVLPASSRRWGRKRGVREA